MASSFQVTKASGNTEKFEEEKLRRSLHHAGADDAVIDEIIKDLSQQLYEGISTKIIFHRALKMLKRKHRPSAARYNLKRALLDFGPSGFPFEDFFAEILRSRGLEARTRQRLPGACILHEVDVVAHNHKTLIWVECKYHPVAGAVSNVKIPLYVHSRFRDLEQYHIEHGGDERKAEGWIATNTRFSEDALSYGSCAGLHMVSWNYPAKDNLRQMVDQYKLHPLTCLTILSRSEKMRLLENGIVLAKSLAKPGVWNEILGISAERSKRIMEEVNALCF